MSRRSLRLSQRKSTSGNISIQGEEDAGSSPTDNGNSQGDRVECNKRTEVSRPRKRIRASSTTVSRRKRSRMPEQFKKIRVRFALLERLTRDVPLDVVFEIFCYLDPGDLLRLARTSKDLRDILMSKTSITIWRSSRENLPGLPPPPKDLNEPQYAQLLFDDHCDVCKNTKEDCETILWSFRMRVCDDCAATDREALPLYTSFRSHQPSQYRDLRAILPIESVKVGTGRLPAGVCSSRLAFQMKEEFELLKTEKERDEWISRKESEYCDIMEHSDLCKAWLKDMQTARLNDILARLEEIGLRPDAQKLIDGYWVEKSAFLDHKLVRQPEKLTDHAWNGMKSQLVKLLLPYKKKRLAQQKENVVSSRYMEFERLYKQALAALDPRDPIPAVGDILTSPAVEEMIWETAIDESLTDDQIGKYISEHLQSFVDHWRLEKIQELVQIMRDSGSTSAAESHLHLAATVFECTECHRGMHFPRMFYHDCCLRYPCSNRRSNKRMRTWYRDYAHFRRLGPWTPKKLVLTQSKSQVLRTILEACALDPSTATVQDLYSAHPLIECITCEMNRGRHFMRRPLLLSHPTNHALSINSFGEETARIFADERVENEPHIFSETVFCAHCKEFLTLRGLDSHLETHHGIDIDENEGLKALLGHCYFDPRSTVASMNRNFLFRIRLYRN
ncbi:hypothetical protein GYMLUDRAFT_229820 [Collybiopsis luxurians FD-317 M1]|uniref:F-box domain-containing protein n=1 Tax=Collybiopsis luxurians FD-317 M1 TaxID=944289 RepID=A0A0D0C3X6_9AGAR|nr:hypothetical protein GYMLUDRAFT_229820 [Collybiopsis luxurians FD-317 M1]